MSVGNFLFYLLLIIMITGALVINVWESQKLSGTTDLPETLSTIGTILIASYALLALIDLILLFLMVSSGFYGYTNAIFYANIFVLVLLFVTLILNLYVYFQAFLETGIDLERNNILFSSILILFSFILLVIYVIYNYKRVNAPVNRGTRDQLNL